MKRMESFYGEVDTATLTRDELLVRLRAIPEKHDSDCEAAHMDADAALLGFINDPEIAEAWDTICKWWS
jgi:hypothetical protein